MDAVENMIFKRLNKKTHAIHIYVQVNKQDRNNKWVRNHGDKDNVHKLSKTFLSGAQCKHV